MKANRRTRHRRGRDEKGTESGVLFLPTELQYKGVQPDVDKPTEVIVLPALSLCREYIATC